MRDLDLLDCSSLTEEERAFLRVSANLLAELAVAEGEAPMQSVANIAAMLGWDMERARRVTRQLARTGLVSKRSDVRRARDAYTQEADGDN